MHLLMQVVVKWIQYGILRKQYISQEQESPLLQHIHPEEEEEEEEEELQCTTTGFYGNIL
jgi:hypothetical protein